jgi:hypothetical protein
MNRELLFNISKDTFYFYYKTISNEDLACILNNSINIKDYVDIDVKYLLKVFDMLNDNTKKELINNVNVDALLCLYKSNKVSETELWENDKIYDDINLTINDLNNNNLLFLINDMNDVKFKMNISTIYFYNLKNMYPFIKSNEVKFKIFINGIDEQFLINLLNYFDSDSVNFLNLNYNFIFRFTQISEFSHLTYNEVMNRNVSKLQIILLLGTSNEHKIKTHILKQDSQFIKNIINSVDSATCVYIMKNIQMSTFYDIFEVLNYQQINILLPYLNIRVLSRLFLKLDFCKLYRVINNLSLNQFIECLYYISDDKLDCLKNMNSQQKMYIENLFSHVNENLYDSYFPYFSKQIIFCILNTNNRSLVIENVKHIDIQIVKLFVKNLNFDEIISVLNTYDNVEQKIDIINSIEKDQYNMLGNYIDHDLHENDAISNNNLVNYKLLQTYINLNLSKFSYNKIKQNLNIDNV